MANQGESFATNPAGVTIFGLGSDGRVYPVTIDATTGKLLVATSSDAPLLTQRSSAEGNREVVSQDAIGKVLIALRVLCRLVAEANAINGGGAAGTDDLDQLIADESATLGSDDRG